MKPIYYDSHMHTPLCKHASGEPEEYAEQGIAAGLKGIIFTCHSPMPRGFWPSVRMGMKEFDEYVRIVHRAAEEFRGRLDVKLGMESDFFPGFEDWIEELHQKADFHYCLGSVHWQGKDYMERFETTDRLAFRRKYFDLLAESAETGLFDCLAHPDLIKNYKADEWDFEEVREDIAAALDRIAKTGVAMELNTSGIYKRFSEMNPGPQMLAMIHERGIPVVLGSDSHQPRRVGESFESGLQDLQAIGFTEVSIFENRKRKTLPLADVLASLRSPVSLL